MADFSIAFERTMKNEGGFTLHTVPGDRGGMTYAGISRKYNPSWNGWVIVDRGDTGSEALISAVKSFYAVNYWGSIDGDKVDAQEVANVLYDFAVNAGVHTAVRLAQKVLDIPEDGVVGNQTITAINSVESGRFVTNYALAKIARYAAIVNHDRSQDKFLLGWVNRALRDVESV
jgi:lysozyme family protein